MTKRSLCLILVIIQLLGCCGALAGSVWYCPKCGRQCTDNYCPSDGTARPQGTNTTSGSTFKICTTQKANVRSGPSTRYPVVDTISKGITLDAVRRVPSEEGGNDWYEILYYGPNAYISVSCVTEVSSSGSGSGRSYYSDPGSTGAVGSSDQGSYTTGNYTQYAYITCTLNSKLATRTGPGTVYDEPGTFLSAGSAVTVLSKAYDSANGIWWVQVEFSYNRSKYRAYTGVKRMNDLNLSSVPEEIPIGSCTVNYSLECYYGPGTEYKQIARNVPAGVSCTIYGYASGRGAYESDYILIEFYDSGLKCWRRAWVHDPYVDDYYMYYGF